jgi:hypothetical protein
MEKINLNRQVFNKAKFNETIDTSFSQLGVQEEDPSFFDINLATQADFFTLYDKFFYDIPKEGEINSHTYLITESTEYVGFQENVELTVKVNTPSSSPIITEFRGQTRGFG